MKTAVVALVVVFNVVLSSPVEEKETYRLIRELEGNSRSVEYARGFRDAVALQKRFNFGATVQTVEKWIQDHGLALTAASCTLACEAATVVETLGISTPVCVGCCGLIGAIGK